jgi:hypothetical protein
MFTLKDDIIKMQLAQTYGCRSHIPFIRRFEIVSQFISCYQQMNYFLIFIFYSCKSSVITRMADLIVVLNVRLETTFCVCKGMRWYSDGLRLRTSSSFHCRITIRKFRFTSDTDV